MRKTKGETTMKLTKKLKSEKKSNKKNAHVFLI